MPRNEAGAFLMSRRAALTPLQMGLAPTARRRVPGLRREEVAALAGVSPDYYARVEQGRVRPSPDVVRAISRALRLGREEHAYLCSVLGPPGGAGDPSPPAVMPPPALARLVDDLTMPAVVLSSRLDVLAANALWVALVDGIRYLPPDRRNMAWLLFVDPRAHDLFVDWDDVATDAAAALRTAAPHDPVAADLVRTLAAASPDFVALWGRHRVGRKHRGVKRFRHPVAGRLDLGYEPLVTSDDGLTVIVYQPADQTSADALALIGALAASPSGPATSARGQPVREQAQRDGGATGSEDALVAFYDDVPM